MKKIMLILCVLAASAHVLADGLLLPSDENYPKEFLQNRMTQVKVFIHGLVAETYVYQEFVNEWSKPVDAVYNFPLPPQARATRILYWRDDTIYEAVLKVREQVVNPGTGEGGIAAEVNKYIGRNGIKIELKAIPAGKLQKIELRYVTVCDYDYGKITFRYPLAAGDFIKYPVEQTEFKFYVWSNSDILEYSIPSHTGAQTDLSEARTLYVSLNRPKQYLDQDLEFTYRVDHQQLGVDFYAVDNDKGDGHFNLFVRPPVAVDPGQVWPKQVIFLLGNSSRLTQLQLSQCLTALSQTLNLLSENDKFNIILYNYSTQAWQSAPVPANSANITAAQNYLKTVTAGWDSRLDLGLTAALNQLSDTSLHNCILLFSDGRALVDPRQIETQNSGKAAIFPVVVGENPDRARMELIAGLNYGFVTYLEENSDIVGESNRLFRLLSKPLLRDVVMEFGRVDLRQIVPVKLPATYVGSYFYMTGRYHNPGTSALSIAGLSVAGLAAYDFSLDFTSATNRDLFAASLWAKEMIDALEREVEVYGETPALKDSLIAISLRHNIRCRYTAYIADYQNEYDNTGVVETASGREQIPCSYLTANYPNPFNASTMICFYISEQDLAAKEKLLKIYNSLGQLVAVIDISHLGQGFHSVRFNANDFNGVPLPSGLYFVRLQAEGTVSTIRITLVK